MVATSPGCMDGCIVVSKTGFTLQSANVHRTPLPFIHPLAHPYVTLSNSVLSFQTASYPRDYIAHAVPTRYCSLLFIITTVISHSAHLLLTHGTTPSIFTRRIISDSFALVPYQSLPYPSHPRYPSTLPFILSSHLTTRTNHHCSPAIDATQLMSHTHPS